MTARPTDDLPGRLDDRVRQHREFRIMRISVDYTDRDAERDTAAAARIRELEAGGELLVDLLDAIPARSTDNAGSDVLDRIAAVLEAHQR